MCQNRSRTQFLEESPFEVPLPFGFHLLFRGQVFFTLFTFLVGYCICLTIWEPAKRLASVWFRTGLKGRDLGATVKGLGKSSGHGPKHRKSATTAFGTGRKPICQAKVKILMQQILSGESGNPGGPLGCPTLVLGLSQRGDDLIHDRVAEWICPMF